MKELISRLIEKRKRKKVAKDLRKKYVTDKSTGVTHLGVKKNPSPGYKKGKYWLSSESRYVDVGSPEHKKDIGR